MRVWNAHSGPQAKFCGKGEYEVLYGGAAGGGKTDCLLICATRNAKNPSSRSLILRRTFPQLQEIIDRAWRYYPHLGGEYRATEHRWHFPSGATVQIGHMQHENDKYNYQGKEFTFVGFDELTQFSETQYLYLHSRVRSTDPSIRPMVRSTTNPGGIGHYWVKARFIDVCPPLETYVDPKTGLTRSFVPGRVYDNPTLIDNDPLYIRRLEALPEVEKQRLLFGVWDIFEGQVFTELSQRVHGYDDFEIPPEWERIVAFDWGFSKPWAALYAAVDYDGVMWIYKEVYGLKDGNYDDEGVRQTNSEIIDAIHESERTDRARPRLRIADPACWGPTKMGGSNTVLGPSFSEDASRGGLFFMKADNDRLRGIQQVHQRFMLETITDKDGVVQREYPRVMVAKSCVHWWRTMTTLRQSMRDPEDIDTRQEDHLYDCFRYLCMSRPIIPKRKDYVPAGSFMAERRRLIRAREYAKRHGCDLTSAYNRVR